MSDVPRRKPPAASRADPLTWKVSAAMSLERGGAVRADDPQVLKAMVIRDSIDVIEHKRHPVTLPDLILPAHLTRAPFQARGE